MHKKCESCGTYIVNDKCGCNLTFADISESVDPSLLSKCDPLYNQPSDRCNPYWVEKGVCLFKTYDPLWEQYIDEYSRIRENMPDIGWSAGTPYMTVPELRNLFGYDQLSDLLKNLVGEEMGLHLNLTGWVSTRRALHQDDYLNPDFINAWYAGVWIALDDIHPDSGPFQYYEGSHRLPFIRMKKIMPFIPVEMREGSNWVYFSEPWVSRALEEECQRQGFPLINHLPKKGEILVWHSRLAHTGSIPKDPLLKRKSVIGHYSALSKRTDMPIRARNEAPGSHGWYFML